MTPAEAAALTQRAEQAEGDAARFERDLTALHGDYDALAVERDGLRATLDAVAAYADELMRATWRDSDITSAEAAHGMNMAGIKLADILGGSRD
jgi:hypothetical protein